MKALIRTLVVLLVAFSLVPSAFAHRPEEGSDLGATPIENASTSFAFYRELSTPDDVHLYSVEMEAGERFHAGINIPQLARFEDYGVTLALIGPDLPPVDPTLLPFGDRGEQNHSPSGLSDLAAELAAGKNGGLLVENEVNGVFFEPFTQTNYWTRQSLDTEAPVSGTYYLLVWNPEGAPGKYVLDTGYEEVFGPADILLFPKWWWDAKVFFEQTPSPAAALSGAGAILTGLAGLVWFSRRRTR